MGYARGAAGVCWLLRALHLLLMDSTCAPCAYKLLRSACVQGDTTDRGQQVALSVGTQSAALLTTEAQYETLSTHETHYAR